jgi:hypothetical protein
LQQDVVSIVLSSANGDSWTYVWELPLILLGSIISIVSEKLFPMQPSNGFGNQNLPLGSTFSIGLCSLTD